MAHALVIENTLVLGGLWLEALRPVSGNLTPPLARIFRDKERSETVHSLATEILADYAGDDPHLLADLLMDADPKAYASLFPIARRQSARTVTLLQAELAKMAESGGTETAREELAQRQARAAVTLIRLGHADEVWPLLRHSADPRLRTFITNWLHPLGTEPTVIAAEVARLDPPATGHPSPATRAMDAILFQPETSMQRGADPGARDVSMRGTLSRRAGAADRQAARPL